MKAIRSQSTCERVSVRGDKICRERVCASQRPGGILPPRSAVTRSRDRKLRSRLRECRGKPGAFPETAGNRICAGLGGGRTRTRTLDPLIKSQLLRFLSKADLIFSYREIVIAGPSIDHARFILNLLRNSTILTSSALSLSP
jgi:hypothetical protein